MLKKLLSKFRGSEPETKVVEHPNLGRLLWEREDWWKGEFVWNGQRITIFLAGHTEPNAESIEKCVEAVAMFDELNKRIRHFISSTLDEYGKIVKDMTSDDYVIVALNFLWPDKPDYCLVNFENDKDEFGLWNCELYNLEPRFLGRDD